MLDVVILEPDPMVTHILQGIVETMEGFQVTGSRQKLQEIRSMETLPQLVLGELYFQDGNLMEWISLLRQKEHPIDFIPVTGERQYSIYKRCAYLGAVDYIVKPFAAQRVRLALSRYREWRERLMPDRLVEQEALDAWYGFAKGTERASERNGQTYQRIWEYIQSLCGEDFTAERAAGALGLSPITLRRYLDRLQKEGKLQVTLQYGRVGRPVNRYREQLRNGG